ncbi:MAG TPA: cobyrinate a,c-diamide synthase [Xanthobacteraceae bacterium]|jgi:cobyrinic acid a,c-diamide synthase|nr:cobyrinate a,c-diamide synthase [Xanthobacteraceae bacterium]
MSARGLIIAAPRSGSGKTTVTLGLLTALARRRIAVRAAKAGPDYIDPAFHAAATGTAGLNLDTWAMAPSLIEALIASAATSADLLVIEAAMGLFDGVPSSPGRSGAAADLAARFDVPVLLVLDVSGQSQTAAAIARGFVTHDPSVRIGGIVLNRVGSERHRTLVADAIAPLGIPVIGAIPRDETLVLPERHLGLVQAREHADLATKLGHLADMIERHLDLDAIIGLARPLDVQATKNTLALPPPGQRIALASDPAFTFTYAHLLDGWRRAGAEIVPFSPLADQAPPENCDVCWLPGGYPELYAAQLAQAWHFRDGVSRFAQTRPVHGECGGYMVLGETLEDANHIEHPMCGLLGIRTSFAKRRLHLGYREATLADASVLGPAGACVRGHEFHYASLVSTGDDERLVDLADGQGRALGPAGSHRGNVTGTFFHAIARS